MKSKILLPLLAVVFALAGAFTSSPVVQMGWYDPGTGGVEGVISTPGDTPTCSLSGDNICKIYSAPFDFNAYDSKAHAETGGETGLLRFTPVP